MSGLPFSSLGMRLTPGIAEGLEAGFGEKRVRLHLLALPFDRGRPLGKWSLTLFSLDGSRRALQITRPIATHSPAGGSAMLSRRRFVQASSLALTGTACSVAKGSEAATGELPPSIAALTSMKDQATPISVDE